VARTYDLTDFALNDPTDSGWALAYVRFALRDKPNDESAYPINSLQDEEITAILAGDALVNDSVTPNVTYYPAHRTAAKILAGNPEYLVRWSTGGVSEELRDPKVVARDIIQAGRWIDALITSESDGVISFNQIRLVT
jgi:hypothetical protein